jgi:hypothetical protein
MSQPVLDARELKIERSIENKSEGHNLTPAVAVCHSEQQSGVEGVRIPLSPPVFTRKF